MSIRSISPLDGRYARQVEDLGEHVSEWALVRARVRVEVEWLLVLAPRLDAAPLRALYEAFSDEDAEAVKAIERRTNHDVKAVEYFLRERVPAEVRELLHFGLTSEDVNNLSYALMLQGAMRDAWRPAAEELVAGVAALAESTRAVPLLSRTHGQPATPTTFGKEMAVFVARWRRQLEQLDRQEYRGKLNGAVGTYGALAVARPEVDWQDVSRRFVESLGLEWSPLTTQIEPHDWIAELFGLLARFNAILVDFDRDVWAYVSRGLVRQRPVAGEVGSSTMPHKVNPIDFENSEANAGVSSALALHMAQTLPISRLQRDLSDSSLLRNGGVVVGHSLLAVRSALRGLGKISVDEAALAAELDDAWEVLAEAVQTVMRKRGGDDPYEQLKALTRGAGIDRERLREFVAAADLDEEDRARLLALTPAAYTGLAERLVDHISGDGA
ncbi:MAG TPA: adenylosuccinate lyase [Solirubrobacteraceae bacterium]|nr:adenylosuccinate lyase [Solirubrobacteraceae bacterium]